MGKNYIESSLKRFLKRKIKITLGLVVAFLITGVAAFGEIIMQEDERDIAKEYLEGTVANNYIQKDFSKLSQEDVNLIQSRGLENYISNKLFDFLKNNNENIDKNNNYGILNTNAPQSTDEKIKIVNNYGIIINSTGYAQNINKGGEGNNYGIIKTKSQFGQVAFNGTINNYGLVINENNNGMHTLKIKENIANNFGIIANDGARAMYISNGTGNNYGVASSKSGQILSVDDHGIINNYGITIAKDSNTAYGRHNNGEGTINDYGMTVLVNNSKAEIGEINGDKFGVILNADNKSNGKRWEIENITLADKGNEHVIKLGNTANKTTLSQNDFTSDKNTSYTQNEQIEIDGNLENTHLTGVLDSTGNADSLYKYTGDNLLLNNTTVVGYFQKNGTLLEVNDTNLTLAGKTLINAAGADLSVNTIALKLTGNSSLSFMGDAKVIGKIVGEEGTKLFNTASHNDNLNTDIETLNFNNDSNNILQAENNYTKVNIKNSNIKQINMEFKSGADKANEIVLDENTVVGKKGETENITVINGEKSNKDINFTINNIENIYGKISLGKGNDTLVIAKNGEHKNIINMNEGNDTLEIKGFTDGTAVGEEHHKEAGNTFDYKVNGAEKIILNGEGWHIGENAELNAGNTVKAGEKTTLHIADNSSLHVEMNNNFGKDDVITSLDKMAEGADLSVTTGKDAEVKFVVGDKFDVSEKQFDVATNYDIEKADISSAVIFNAEKVNDKDVRLTVKEASEIKNDKGQTLENYKAIYDTMLGTLSSNPDLRDAVNYQNANELVDMVIEVNNTASAFYTTGYAVTKDVTDTYMSVVEDFGRKAGKGEWIAYGKYVNSDTEFDGGKSSKGYDGDIIGTVGMIEYGVNDTTSYGAVFGKGDTEVDIQGGGKLDGDNTYAGVYMKHRTQTGIDLTANVGYTKSDLDLDLATSASIYNMITSGSSDSDALTFALKGTKDYKVSDSVRLQPVVSARYSLINQDAVESRDANFRIDEQDVTIFEGAFGGNIIKDFNISNGTLSLMAGAELVLTEVSKSDDGRYTLYEKEITLLDEEDIADNRIEGHIGAEYIHENGVGIDAKYEMIWTDKGDTDRITAGISYKF